MNLKTQTDYALRTLLFLAHRGEKQKQVPVDEIAQAYQISKDHLVKVVQQLVRMGYVQSRAGRNGGIKLAKDPAGIKVSDVVGEFEGRNGVLPCVTDETYCRLEPGCALRNLLIKAEEMFYDTLARMTISDLIKSNTAKGSGGLYNLTITRQSENNAPSPVAQPRD
jgi:Rrf2 family nitric oxide-sensitive transcriptional repressor